MTENIQKILQLADDSTLRFVPENLNWSWGQALYLYALARIDIEFGQDKYTEYIKRFYDHHIAHSYRLCSSDSSAPALGALYLAQKTGEQTYWDVVDRARTYFANAPRIWGDMPNHHGTALEGRIYPKSIWIDSIMMYGVFTNWLASATGDKELQAFAARQPAAFAQLLQDPATGFFHHCYWTNAKKHYPPARKPMFWGRGNGWVMASVPLLMEHLPEAEQAQVKAMFTRLAGALLPYQREDGYFETIFVRPRETYKESSATMLIAAGWFWGYRTGLLGREYYDAAVKAFNAVCNDLQLHDGQLRMPHISAPTSAIPLVPYLVYKNTPRGTGWTYGLAGAFFAGLEYHRCK